MSGYQSKKLSAQSRENRIDQLEEAVERLLEFVDDYSDVVDGDYGIPEPNEAMSLATAIRDMLTK
jgi:hypothetical protein